MRSPNRTPLLLGGVGHFFAGGMAIPFAALFLAVDPSGASTTPAPAVLALGVVTILALVLHSIGFYGFWKNYKSTLAVVTFGYGLVASGVLVVAVVPAVPSATIRSAALLVLSAMFVLDAAAFLANRHIVAHGESLGAGVLFLVAAALVGASIAGLTIALAAGILAAPALFLGGTVLLRAPVPIVHAG